MKIDNLELERILIEGESYRVERKESLAGGAPSAIREAICAFSNDLPGADELGVVFIGVKDNGASNNLVISDEMLRQLADMKSDGQIVPPPTMFVEKRRVHSIETAVVTVVPSDSPPVRYRGSIQIRIGPRKGIATAQDERILNEKRRFKSVAFDIQPVPGADPSVLNLRIFQEEYLPVAFSAEVLAANERSLEERLAATKMIASVDDHTVTVLGLLVLGKRPRDYVPSFYIRVSRNRRNRAFRSDHRRCNHRWDVVRDTSWN